MTETTTELTTLMLHERLAKVQYSKNKRPTATYWGVALEDVAAIERELIDAATEELRERVAELEIYKSTYAKELSACGTTIAQLREEVERLKKVVRGWERDYYKEQKEKLYAVDRYTALKAKADALRDAGDKLSAEAEHMFSQVEDQYEWRAVGEAVDAWRDLMQADAAEPREETPSESLDNDPRVHRGTEFAAFLGEQIAKRSPSPDRDGEPGEADGLDAPVSVEIGWIKDRITELERLRSSDVATYRDRFNQQQRQIDDDHKVIDTLQVWGVDLQKRLAALEAGRELGAVPTVVSEAMIDALCVSFYWKCEDSGSRDEIRAGLAAALKAGGGQ